MKTMFRFMRHHEPYQEPITFFVRKNDRNDSPHKGSDSVFAAAHNNS